MLSLNKRLPDILTQCEQNVPFRLYSALVSRPHCVLGQSIQADI